MRLTLYTCFMGLLHLIKLLGPQFERLAIARCFRLFADSKYELASIQNGGFLKIYQIDSNQDAGTYTCIVQNRGGEEARREIELTVNSMWNTIWPFGVPASHSTARFIFSHFDFISCYVLWLRYAVTQVHQ